MCFFGTGFASSRRWLYSVALARAKGRSASPLSVRALLVGTRVAMSRSLVILLLIVVVIVGGLFFLAGRDAEQTTVRVEKAGALENLDRKSTRLNSSH